MSKTETQIREQKRGDEMNKNELRAQMARHGDNTTTLSKALGITVPTLSCKVNGSQNFKQPEIQMIIDRYGLTAEETMSIFFAPQVSKTET